MKKIPRILSLGVLALAPLQSVIGADYQYIAPSGTVFWESIAPASWNQNPPWAGTPPAGVGPTASDNLSMAGAVTLFLGNAGENIVKNYGIDNLSAVAGTPQHLSGGSATRAALTANSITLSNNAYLSISRGSNSAVLGVDTGTLSIASGATFYAGHATTNGGSITRFVVSGSTIVNGQLSNSVRNTGEINFGDLFVNAGGSVGLGDNEIATAITFNSTPVVKSRSLSGAGYVYGSNINNNATNSRRVTFRIETESASNAIFSGTFSDSSPTATGTNSLSVSVSGAGRQTFSGGASTYTGTTSIQNATLAVAVLANGGSASSIGSSGTAATNLIIDGGTLEYIGNTASTNRLFTVGSNGATLNASGAGTITYSATNAVTYSAAGNNSLGFSGSGNGVFAGRINDHATSGETSVSKSGSGTWVLSGSNGYTGATNITGGKLIVDGFINASSGVNVSEGATLGGHGRVSRISGAGTVAAGNSPGILTATDVDASGGLDFAFEFTIQATDGVSVAAFGNAANSGNDVLRLTDGTPFEFSLTLSNTIAVDFSAVTLADGDRYLGGFYVDSGNFLTQLENAQFTYSGINGFAITVSTVQQTANFGNGQVGGYMTEFTVHAIPEPSSIALFGLSLIGFGALLRHGRIS